MRILQKPLERSSDGDYGDVADVYVIWDFSLRFSNLFSLHLVKKANNSLPCVSRFLNLF